MESQPLYGALSGCPGKKKKNVASSLASAEGDGPFTGSSNDICAEKLLLSNRGKQNNTQEALMSTIRN